MNYIQAYAFAGRELLDLLMRENKLVERLRCVYWCEVCLCFIYILYDERRVRVRKRISNTHVDCDFFCVGTQVHEELLFLGEG